MKVIGVTLLLISVVAGVSFFVFGHHDEFRPDLMILIAFFFVAGLVCLDRGFGWSKER